jgi:hypothetical protein
MKLAFLSLSPTQRDVYFTEAASLRGLSPVIVEKDFWVCWLLCVLFESEFSNSLVFKGGTSLSKVFRVIERFSEDIDLSLAPEFLQLPPAGTSRNQVNQWMRNAESACGSAVQNRIAPALENVAKAALGSDRTWFEFITDAHTHSPVLLFHYPCVNKDGFDYIQRFVKLEFGSLTDQQPTGRHPIQPWIAESLPVAFPDWKCEVVALEVERTFWAKATILHMEFHRAPDKPTPTRYSRHYADMAALDVHPTALQALENHALRQRVVDWKSRFFGSAWANYDLAKPGTFKLVPPEHRKESLSADYDAMRDMYFSDPRSFDEVLQVLIELESRINRE